jgi:RNA polymerase sigma-70 factor (ECF subfamily)
MDEGHTTIVVQRCLNELARLEGGRAAEPVIRELLDRSVSRLHVLCQKLLVKNYPRLARPPLNLRSEEVLSAVAYRLLQAMKQIRPATVRQFFGLVNRHMRWELNSLARNLDLQPATEDVLEALVPEPESSGSQLTPVTRRMLEAIEALPDDQCEVFSLVRIQGMTHTEVADVLGTSTKTVQRRLNRALMNLADKLHDLQPLQPPSSDD